MRTNIWIHGIRACFVVLTVYSCVCVQCVRMYLSFAASSDFTCEHLLNSFIALFQLNCFRTLQLDCQYISVNCNFFFASSEFLLLFYPEFHLFQPEFQQQKKKSCSFFCVEQPIRAFMFTNSKTKTIFTHFQH